VINNSILSDSTGTVADYVQNTTGGGSASSSGSSNLITNVSTFQGTASAANPNLAPLANNGGPTQTMAISGSSLAANAGNNALIPGGVTTDQRGLNRIYGAAVDIGAFEVQPINSLVVSTVTDEDDGNSDPTFGAGTSLREALNYAVSLGGNRTVTFAPGVTGTIALTQALTYNSGGGSVTIQGPGITNLTVSGNNVNRVFNISAGALVINDLTISGGNPGSSNGGGIFNFGTLTLNSVVVSNNQVTGGTQYGGAGIYSLGTLDVNDSAIFANTGAYFGGGVYIGGGTASMTKCTIVNNTATFNGGLTIVVSTGTVTNCTISNNSGSQGAVAGYVAGTSLSFLNSTIALNQSEGFWDLGGTYTFQNTIVGNNNGPDIRGTITSLGNNLFENTGLGSGYDPSDILNINPLISPLQNNGGPFGTIALLPGSPAIDAGNSAAAGSLTTDARGSGFARVKGTAVDIGAYELQTPLVFSYDSGSPQSTPTNTQFTLPLKTKLVDSTGAPLVQFLVSFSAPASGPSVDFGRGATFASIRTDSNGIASVVATANSIPGTFSITASVPGQPDVSFTLTNTQSPVITSADNAGFTIGVGGTFTIQTTGSPIPAITSSTLPAGVTLIDNSDGTAALQVSNSTSLTAGSYPFQITASNGNNPDAVQSFTLSLAFSPPVITFFGSDDNPGIIYQPVTYRFSATDSSFATLTYVLNFGNGAPPRTGTFAQGTFVTETTSYEGYTIGIPVSLTVSNGGLSASATVLQIIPMPSTTGDGITNIGIISPPIVEPLDGLSAQVASSSGGVVQLGIDVSSLTRASYDVTTDFGDVSGRSAKVTGTHPIHKYENRGLFVAKIIAVNKDTQVEAGKARLTLAVSSKETGDFPEHDGPAQLPKPQPQIQQKLPLLDGILPNDKPSIAMKSFKGKFDFTGKSPDLIAYTGTITLPPGLDLRKDYEFWIAIGNVIVKSTIVKGRGTNYSVPGIIKSLKISTKAKITYLTVGGEQATIAVVYSTKDTVGMGFDTEGISNKSTDVGGGKVAPRKIQVAMLVDGAPFQTVTPVDFSLSNSNTNLGTISGRSQK